ncbi:transcriptional regulator, LysR family [Thiohalospira halophila DSM 15071]|uniref:Transcriptional regulator, LysR family n=1 Tax=Thiohalospira halophila DSM 15071 TaxID=1123397 RepID=A0A1I1SEI3_9GAMM|nr:LysR family transcriptional regulator [Thiohalospira halophila]SFD44899.1 transcriptional regulator, LysR family [Thiohalospira halophila DSM 15071]
MRRVTFRQLRVFDAVARHLSFTRAAEELHLTQPAVSMQVKQLEDSAGLPLFEQLGRRIHLTEAGRLMLDHARAIEQQMDDLTAGLEALGGVQSGVLDVAVASTANYFATRLLAEFNKRFDEVTVRLEVTNRAGLLNQLAENTRDMVIMGQPPEESSLVAEAFMENPLVVIAPPDHPLAGEGPLPFERLREETFVIREQGSGTRIAMERHFARHGLELRTGMEMSSNEAIKQAVEAGLGLGLVSIHTLGLERETGHLTVLDVEDFPILRHWYLVYREGKRLSPAASALRSFLLEEASALIEPAYSPARTVNGSR